MKTILELLDGDIAETERQLRYSEQRIKAAIKSGAWTEAADRAGLIARGKTRLRDLATYREAYLAQHGGDL